MQIAVGRQSLRDGGKYERESYHMDRRSAIARQACESSGGVTPRTTNCLGGWLAYPMHPEATKQVQFGPKNLDRPATLLTTAVSEKALSKSKRSRCTMPTVFGLNAVKIAYPRRDMAEEICDV